MKWWLQLELIPSVRNNLLWARWFYEDFLSPTLFGVLQNWCWKSIEEFVHYENSQRNFLSTFFNLDIITIHVLNAGKPTDVYIFILILATETFHLRIRLLMLKLEESIILFELVNNRILLSLSIILTNFNHIDIEIVSYFQICKYFNNFSDKETSASTELNYSNSPIKCGGFFIKNIDIFKEKNNPHSHHLSKKTRDLGRGDEISIFWENIFSGVIT